MEYVVIAVVFMLVAAGILHAVMGRSRYANMTEQEFEEEARRGSPAGNALMSVQGIIEPNRKVEYVLQQDKRFEGESAESGDRPPDDSPAPPDPKTLP
ncbi:MAG: hypothetical protein ACRD5F_14650 [Candidatus Acidiferrales bacterium]